VAVHPIAIPKLGMSIDEATLSEWLVEDGQNVEAGTPLYVAAPTR
jgi:pyruvate/2-oxoglutarate dehydrogenase complex dihydrolipoamide acyltransferase (E2) component